MGWWLLFGIGLGYTIGFLFGVCYLSFRIASIKDKTLRSEITSDLDSLCTKIIDYQVRTRNR
jgi:hypothetical protein